ncbi:magnesium protoporphyrin IX methyltransferase [Candidatus Atelocyanobacterium thalassae]|uniref:Magnesium protoporphyrin IX methyltransferase n=1 Tax=cyanobacterium endosymbiont of Braarudosphaera bigelowii TaxID=1285375 RepID=A0ABM7U680_9CHRO|nr:magnesium protoporphyrin IX methyltransferase [Candidatus Atelocyanobacterium thalassa]BDA40207.1 magnesium-protoporphyrin O-methyltransferase [cyanobacterium endosymbiont of Braarudosphaera bigelowii]
MKINTDDKTVVKDYFNAIGFDRWQNIYGNGKVNKVQEDIRFGHQQTINTVLEWLKLDGNLSGLIICDAGCGVGSLSIPLAKEGAIVSASDISEKMVTEAKRKAENILGKTNNINFYVQDLEKLKGSFHTIICLDVLIHYPTDNAAKMINHLASLTNCRIILSFAPKTFYLTVLKKIGEFFPGPSKTTRAYQHSQDNIVQTLKQNGFKIQRKGMTSTKFYYSQIIEAIKE